MISILVLISMTGVTLVGHWFGVDQIFPEVKVAAYVVYIFASAGALGAWALADSTSQTK